MRAADGLDKIWALPRSQSYTLLSPHSQCHCHRALDGVDCSGSVLMLKSEECDFLAGNEEEGKRGGNNFNKLTLLLYLLSSTMYNSQDLPTQDQDYCRLWYIDT